MINEKDLVKLRARPDQLDLKIFEEMAETIELLWKVYRAAWRWRVALHGRPAVEAEDIMAKEMDKIRAIMNPGSASELPLDSEDTEASS